MSSIENTTVLNTENTLSRKRKNRVEEHDDEDTNLYHFENDCDPQSQVSSSRNRCRNFKYGEQENKEKRREKHLEKEYSRQNQEPSNRLGKNAKKVAARRSIVLNEHGHTEVEIMKGKNSEKINTWIKENPQTIEMVQQVIGVKSRQIYGRLKRKPGHRGKPEVTILDFEDNELEFPEM